MSKPILYLLCEDGFQYTSWSVGMTKSIGEEAARHGILLQYIHAENALPTGEIAVVLGSSPKYLSLPGRVLFAGESSPKNSGAFSSVSLDRRQAMKEIVQHLHDRGARRIALLGTDINVQSDYLRFLGWQDAVQELGIGDGIHHAFHRNASSEHFYQEFLQHAHEYDAVACTSDGIALKLITILQSHQFSIPGDIKVTGFGNLYLGQWSAPTLTSVHVNLKEVGRQVVQAWIYLMAHPKTKSMLLTLEHNLIPRESTADLPRITNASDSPLRHRLLPQDLPPTTHLERLFSCADMTDLRLLRGIARNLSNEQLCEETYLSYSAVKRHLSRIYEICRVQSKKELTDLIHMYIPRFADEDNLNISKE